MVLYNVTVTLELSIHEDWLRWMLETHIPDVMITGMFISYRMSRLIGHDHNDAEIYTIQYLLKDLDHLTRYQQEFAPDLQRQVRERYEGKFEVFRTIMEVVDTNEMPMR